MRSLRLVRHAVITVVVIVVIAAATVYFSLRASLPQLEGEIHAPRLEAAASIERDTAGTPTIRAASRADLAFATGFAHAQDRFFQMDLMRRVEIGRAHV